MNEPKEFYDYDHPTTGRTYAIKYYYQDGDKIIKCTISLKPIDPKKEEILIRSFDYDTEKRGDNLEETAKVIAIDHGNMNPRDELDID